MANGPHVVPVNDDNFEREVLSSDVPVLVDFGGKWCGPCRALEPIVEKLASELNGKVKVVSIDTDEAPLVTRRYGVRGVPTVMAFTGGAERGKIVGLTTREKLLGLLG